MRKAACVLVLIASICFQGVALAKRVLAGELGGDAAHAALHADRVAHHHHDDGSVHEDASTKSKHHVQQDGCPGVAAIPPSRVGVAALNPPQALASAAHDGHESPFLEGLKRPPRNRA